ncbi:MAG: hypothetical protein NTZ70_05120, partial [Methylococcales bacterium]|nr:hypothetical protein [Methylococcales bacterium]
MNKVVTSALFSLGLLLSAEALAERTLLKCELRAKKPEQSSKNKMRPRVCRKHEPKVHCMSVPCWHIQFLFAV